MEQQQLRFEDLSWWNKRQQMSLEELAVAFKEASEQVSDEEFGSLFKLNFEQISDEHLDAFVKRLMKDHPVDAEKEARIKQPLHEGREILKQMSKEQIGKLFKIIIMFTTKENLEEGFELAQNFAIEQEQH